MMPDMKPIPPYRQGQHYLRADDLNAQVLELIRLGKLQVAGALELEQGNSGPLLTVPPPVEGLWARITGRSGTAYSWVEQRPIRGGLFEDKELGRTGTVTDDPAYEVTLNQTVPAGTPVWLERSFVGVTDGERDVDWRFEFCCAPNTALSGDTSGFDDDLIVTPFCPNGLPRHLSATFTNHTNCDCIDGLVLDLTYTGGGWFGSGTACGVTITVSLTYTDTNIITTITIGGFSDSEGRTFDQIDCDAFSILHTIGASIPDCDGTPANVTIDITA